MSNETRRPRGPHGRSFEKPKNFKIAIINIIKSLKKYWTGIIISFILAAIASILALMAPNKLSSLTDELTNGLKPNQEAITDIMSYTFNNNMEMLVNKIFDFESIIINANSINWSNEEQEKVNEFLTNLNKMNFMNHFNSLPRDIKIKLMGDSTVDGINIKAEEKLAILDMSLEDSKIEELPDSLLKIVALNIPNMNFEDMNYEGVTVTIDDQKDLLNLFLSTSNKDVNNLYKQMDNLNENIYNIIKPKINMSNVKDIVINIALLYGSNAILTYILGLIVVYVVINYSKGLRNKISLKINKLPLKYFDQTTVGDTLSRVTNDVDTISQSMHQSLSSLVSAITLFIGSIIMMFYTNYIMAITAILSSLFGLIFMFKILNKSQKYFITRQREIGNINGHIEEVFSGHNVVTLYNGKEIVDKKFDELNESVYVSERKSQFLSGLMHPFMAFIGNFGYVAVCIVGAILTMKSVIGIGVIIAFMIYIRQFTNPLTQIAQSMTSLQSAAAAGERVFEFLNQKEMADESAKTKILARNDVKGEIIFDHVKFGYDNDKVIIKDFNAHIKPGQKIAIVGPTGAGKTTLVNLLMRFYEINEGDIKIDGVSTKDLTRDNIHNLFIMVLQDTWLFNGTIRENICYNKENITDEQIMKSAKIVGIDHYIKTLPKGLDSEITDTNSISSGQKQLLTIARGMIENAPFLILDEATSNVDTRTEELVQKAMDKLTEGRTSFIIAHRLSTIKNADLILVMNEGNIIEQGNHDELMKKNGFYANLYNSQFEKVNN